MHDFQEIEKVIKDDDLTKYKDYKDYQEEIENDFKKLFYYKLFIERKNLTLYWWESYTKTKYYLKELVLEDKNIPEDLREAIFYDWLKICINPQKDVNYDFYFEKYNRDKEDEVKMILFENGKGGKLREIFQRDDWQIRLRTIADWFLKRYDIKTARRIYKNIKSPYKRIFDTFKLFMPRLFGAVFIGLLPLILGQGTWDLPLELGLGWVIVLFFTFLFFSYLYLTIECFNITRCKTGLYRRVARVLAGGFAISFVYSLLVVFVMAKHSVDEKYLSERLNFLGKYLSEGFNFLVGLTFLENILFYSSLSIFIGIFIQVFWEEKTITEPL